MQDEVLKVALIGVGNVGKKYARMIAAGEVPNMKLSAVVIRRDELMEWGRTLVNADGESARIFRSADELFEAEDSCYDAVIVATPHKTHKELVLKAFAKGKAVLCDKPAAADIGEALAMQEAASESGRIYGMIFHQRFYPKYIKIKQMIDDGELGDIKRVCLINSRYLRTSFYHKSGSWRSSFTGEGGGALINQGQHILDMYQNLFGMPQKLFASIPFGKYNDFLVDDEATIVMEYDNGMTGTFILSTGEACHEERLEIVGTKARILMEDDMLTITKHPDVCEYIRNEEVTSREHMTYTEETIEYRKKAEPYAELFENFANAVLNNDASSLKVKGSEGINSLMLCAGAYYSACKGVKVELPLDAGDYKKLMDELTKKEGKE